MRLGFLDAGVLIQAATGRGELVSQATALIDDGDREFVWSRFLKLELLPKPAYLKGTAELAWYESFFAEASREVKAGVEEILAEAEHLAVRYGLNALDSLHVAAALREGCAEFITTEVPKMKRSEEVRPLYRVKEIQIVYLGSLPGFGES